MTCNNYVNIKEMNNLVGANKLGPSLKKKGEREKRRKTDAACVKLHDQGNVGSLTSSLPCKELQH